MAAGPLLVFGPRSLTYDFGAWHPLTPRRFGPGIDLLRYVGARPELEPGPATDDEIGWLHAREYIEAVRRFSENPHRPPEAGISPGGDDPPFAGMHDASASVAGGSMRAMEAILRGDTDHAYHPGGGLHHAMRHRASGFCIYNDPALAIARARADGLRVLYVDLDVHHGDGVQSLLSHDPGVLTVSFHETGRTLFPGTGFVGELGMGEAAGTSVNVPLEPLTGPNAWLSAVRAVVPPLAAAFAPDVIVSQHGADSHAWDPLAHLSVTTSAMGEAARLVDALAHRYAGGRWLSTGGGGYCAYRVVPRAWALTWLAGAHRDAPHHLPEAWLARWADDAERHGDAPLPAYFDDDPTVVAATPGRVAAAEIAAKTVRLVRALAVPALLRIGADEGWWSFEAGGSGAVATGDGIGSDAALATRPGGAQDDPSGRAGSIVQLTPDVLDRLAIAERTIAPADPAEACGVLRAALLRGATAFGAVAGEWLVGVALSAPLRLPDGAGECDQVAALGVTPAWRSRGIAEALVRRLVAASTDRGRGIAALITVAERDPVEPLPVVVRRGIAGRLLRSAGMEPLPVPAPVADADPHAVLLARLPEGAPSALRTAVLAALSPA